MGRNLRSRALPEKLAWALPAGLCAAGLGWLGLYGIGWNDYAVELQPSVRALVHGHLSVFLGLAPLYGGSLIERAPFALLPGLWGGGELAVYRLLALPCLLAVVVLAAWLAAWMRANGRSTAACMLALVLCTANPLALKALEVGHPEELLGGALCVAAVLLAARGRAIWAGLLLGAAIANKEWAVLALGPVLLALPARRVLCGLCAAGVAGALLAPFALAGSGGFISTAGAVSSTSSTIFQPWQIWWFLAHHGPLVHGLFGEVKPGYRTAPGWVGPISHPLVLAVGAALSVMLALSRNGPRAASAAGASRPREREALLLLALLLLCRCMLDTWDTAYYAIPFVLALLTWEVRTRSGAPLLTLAIVAAAWFDYIWLAAHASPDVQAAVFLAWSLPLAGLLGLVLYAPGRVPERLRRLGSGGAVVIAPLEGLLGMKLQWQEGEARETAG